MIIYYKDKTFSYNTPVDRLSNVHRICFAQFSVKFNLESAN